MEFREVKKNLVSFHILKLLRQMFVNFNDERDKVGFKIWGINRKNKTITLKFKILNKGRRKKNER